MSIFDRPFDEASLTGIKAWGLRRARVRHCVECGESTDWMDVSLCLHFCSEGCLGSWLDAYGGDDLDWRGYVRGSRESSTGSW